MKFILFLFFIGSMPAVAQDTLKLAFPNFIKSALEFAPLLKAENEKVNQALSKLDEVKSNRFLPVAELSTNHGVVPGVSSPSGLPRDEWHLDPNLRNEWSDWKVFSQIKLSLGQPIFTWGALSNAIEASKAGAQISEMQRDMKESDYKVQLTKLYFSLVLANELTNLADEAIDTIEKAKKKLDELDDDDELDDKEIFKFKIYEQQFLIKAEEIYQTRDFVQSSLNTALGTKDVVYQAATDSLNEINPDQALTLFEQEAVQNRLEIKALDKAHKAVDFGIQAQKSLRYPMIFFGVSGEYVNTPRPVTTQPLIGSRFNYLNLAYSFGIRQSLNFGSMNAKIDGLTHKKKEIDYSKEAVGQAILLDVQTAYKNFKVAEIKKKKLFSALQTSKEWLRKEQIDYDLGLGEIKNLVEAMKMNLELKAEFTQSQYDLSVKEALLLKAIGKLN